MLILGLNPSPFLSDAAYWTALMPILEPFGGVRVGFKISNAGGIEGRSIDEVVRRCPGKTIYYQHTVNPALSLAQNRAAHDKERKRLSAAGATFIPIGPNEPPEFSSVNDPGYNAKLGTLMDGTGGLYAVGHGHFHNPGETYIWEQELERDWVRCVKLKRLYGSRPLAKNRYFSLFDGPHPVEQARLKCLICSDPNMESHIYHPDGFDEFELGLTLGMCLLEVAKHCGVAGAYASADNQPNKNFGFLSGNVLKADRWRGFQSAF